MTKRARHAAVLAGLLMIITGSGVGVSAAGAGTVRPDGTPSTIPDLHRHAGAGWKVGVPQLNIAPKRNIRIYTQCRPSQITATGSTRRVSSGVVGLVTFVGAHRCTPVISSAPSKLLDFHHHPLSGVTTRTPTTTTNPVSNYRSPFGLHSLAWSFAWTGSQCGRSARYVVFPRSEPPSGLRVRRGVKLHATPRLVVGIHGPRPMCAGSSSSTLIPGIAGFPRSPIQTPPDAWRHLAATLNVPATDPYSAIAGLSVGLTNPTATPITLSPCPDYILTAANNGGKPQLMGIRTLSCGSTPAVVPAHGSLHIPLNGPAGGMTHPGDTFDYEFGIAGVATATATLGVSATSPPTLDPSHGGVDAGWDVSFPPSFGTGGGPTPNYKPCTVSQMTATASTRITPDGVDGLVIVRGEECKLPLSQGPTSLSAGGSTLDVTTVPVSQQPDPVSIYPDTSMLYGKTQWSFSWNGSWCGAAADTVVLPLDATRRDPSPGSLSVPLSGPSPTCSGASNSQLLPGAAAFIGQPSEAAPASWAGLSATLNVPKVIRGLVMQHSSVTLTNSTGSAITLAPCPTYDLELHDQYGDGGSADSLRDEDGAPTLGCNNQPTVVPADGAVTIALPPKDIHRQDLRPDGKPVRFDFAIQGIAAITAYTRLGPIPDRDPSHAGRDTAWRVAAPALERNTGHPYPKGRVPACRPSQIAVGGSLRAANAGVVGVVHAHATTNCYLHLKTAPSGFLGSNGKRLAVPIRKTPAYLRGSLGSDEAGMDGPNAYAGFAWRGSWCGGYPESVVVTLRDGKTVTGPMTGRTPTCDLTSTAKISRGLVGSKGESLQTAPRSWRGLTAQITVTDVASGTAFAHPIVMLANPTEHRIVLAPCPSYSLLLTIHGHRSLAAVGGGGALLCPHHPRVLTPRTTLTLSLKHIRVLRPPNMRKDDPAATLAFGMAGVPVATTTLTVEK